MTQSEVEKHLADPYNRIRYAYEFLDSDTGDFTFNDNDTYNTVAFPSAPKFKLFESFSAAVAILFFC